MLKLCKKNVRRMSEGRRAWQEAGAVAVALVLAGALLSGCGDAASGGGAQRSAAPEAQETALQESQKSRAEARPAPQESTGARPEAASGARAAASPENAGDAGAPEGMVRVPGGTTRIGISEATWERIQHAHEPGSMRPPWGHAARPAFDAEVAPFFLEKHPVTVAQFRQFVEEAGYETEAERFGDAGVMEGGQWRLVRGATWRHPLGPGGEAAPGDHPVTQVSWNDAVAYCEWKGRRLPTEVEWEHAARGGTNSRALCPWPGGACDRAARLRSANTWQGRFPFQNTAEDGYRYTSPVGAFGETALGLTDMAGNVWEWTSSWYRPYAERGTPFRPTAQSEKVQRGGSFQCNECGGYRVFARSHATQETSLFHVGIRCAKDAPSE